ncbi:MAG: hypothetical protein DRH26_17645 [Deltaproteobacteria bacterium]|nr:MAG: hypothetical protein DRH26_17645 [Deltaproteobacteria bacterium]
MLSALLSPADKRLYFIPNREKTILYSLWIGQYLANITTNYGFDKFCCPLFCICQGFMYTVVVDPGPAKKMMG